MFSPAAPNPRNLPHPHDRAARMALHHFVLDKQVLRAPEVILCMIYWLAERMGTVSVTAHDPAAVVPRRS